jgi:hypothetical protein
MKLKNIFKKTGKNIDPSNFKALDKTHLQKVAGGEAATPPKRPAGVKYENIPF